MSTIVPLVLRDFIFFFPDNVMEFFKEKTWWNFSNFQQKLALIIIIIFRLRRKNIENRRNYARCIDRRKNFVFRKKIARRTYSITQFSLYVEFIAQVKWGWAPEGWQPPKKSWFIFPITQFWQICLFALKIFTRISFVFLAWWKFIFFSR